MTEGLLQAMQSLQGEPTRLTGIIPGSWSQGRTAYGGIVAALTCEGIARSDTGGAPARALQINFIGPAAPDQALLVETRLLRRGRNAQQWEAGLVQNGQTCCRALVTLGAARESALRVPADPLPDVPEPAACREMPQRRSGRPFFTDNFQFHYHLGGFPFSGTVETRIAGWFRLREEKGPVSTGALLGLLDAWPSPLLQQLSELRPSSSMTWYVECTGLPEGADCADYWYYDSVADYSRDGYTHFHARLWHESGALVAITRQVVATFA